MLAELSLDTTTFTALADRVRGRIAAASRSAWTDHNAHDPGITLLELYAYLLEQRVFWLDQVTPALDLALLRLLGIVPRRARAARVVLTALPRAAGAHGVLPRHTALSLAGSPPVTFTTDQEIAVVGLAPDGVDVRASVTGARRRGLDLRNGRTIVVMPRDGRPAQLDVLLRLDSPWTRRAEPVSLLLELVSPLLPQWHPDAVAAPPPAKLDFVVRGPAGLRRLAHVQDGTGGLRRSGVVRLWVGDWTPEADGSYLVRVRTDAATFSAPVRLSRVTVNAVLARHRARGTEVVTESWPKLPGRAIELRHANGPPLSGQLDVHIRERDAGRPRRWREVQDLTPERPEARVFALDGRVLRFGDGRAGRQPVLAGSGERIRVGFWAGGGEGGNVSAKRSFEHAALTVTNPVAAAGGRGDESLADARARAAAVLREASRAVTGRDVEQIAEATPGVAVGRAIAVAGLDEDRPLPVPGLTTVYVIPAVPRGEERSDEVEPAHVPDPMPDPGALAAVRGQLESGRLLGSELRVLSPRWRDVCLRLVVRAPAATPGDLRERLHLAMEAHLDSLVGGDEGRGWPLGGAIDPSALMRRAQDVLGDGASVEEVSVEVAGREPESCRPVPIGACHLPRLLATDVARLPPQASGGLE